MMPARPVMSRLMRDCLLPFGSKIGSIGRSGAAIYRLTD
jgi:hypothetical protein